jgi:hypothetical protein
LLVPRLGDAARIEEQDAGILPDFRSVGVSKNDSVGSGFSGPGQQSFVHLFVWHFMSVGHQDPVTRQFQQQLQRFLLSLVTVAGHGLHRQAGYFGKPEAIPVVVAGVKDEVRLPGLLQHP